MKKSSFLFFLLYISFINSMWAQNIQDWVKEKDSFPLVKLYLHIDRNFYFQKEDVWFKSYFLDGVTHKRMPGKQNLFVDLIDKNGKTVVSKMFLIIDGLSAGNITIPDDINPGKYLLKAYTEYQTKLGDDIFFTKTIQISEVKNTVGLDDSKNEPNEPALFSEVLFLPEGGFILAEANNTVAFKIIDKKGRGLEGQGKIVDQNGNVITNFSTNYKGMGKFRFMPERDCTYFAEIGGEPAFKTKILDIRNKGSKIQLALDNEKELVFEAITITEEENNTIYLACMSRGNLLFYKEFSTTDKYKTFVVNKNLLRNGINRFVILNESFEPLSERLVFFDKKDVNYIEIKANSDIYDTRSLVELQLFNGEKLGENEFSKISMAVVDDNSIDRKDNKMNILTWSLLDSELHNFTESSLGYLQNDSLLNSKEKLDLLMLTHGWSTYIWNDTTKLKKEDRIFTSGITIKGTGKRLLSNNPLSNASALMKFSTKNDDVILSLDLDSEGKFAVKNLFFTDTATVFIQIKNKNSKTSGEIILDPIFEKKPALNPEYLNNLSTLSDFSVEFYRRKYFAEAEKREFYPDNGTILLEDIDVIENKKEEKDEHPRIYGQADRVIEVTEMDATYINIFDFLAGGRVAGVSVDLTDNSITMRGVTSFSGGSSPPMFLIDGVAYDGDMGADIALTYSMNDIDKVEILKSAGNLAMFGSRGAGGVIAIYTKKGVPSAGTDTFVKGTITKSIIGFAPYRKFYSPTYTPDNKATPEPDRRTTLYWNPDINLGSVNQSVSFYTSDQQSNYKIIIEGITNSGKVCLGFGELKVGR